MDTALLLIAAESLRVVRRFLFRSALVALTTALGVSAVIVSVNFAAAGREQALRQIARMGVNILTITPQADRGQRVRVRTGGLVHTLLPADYREIRAQVPAVAEGSPLSSATLRIKAGDLSRTAQILGGFSSYPLLKDWTMQQGEWFSADEDRRSSRVAVLGSKIARDLFGSDSPLQQRLFIDRAPFVIIGVVEEHGQGLDAVSEDEQVYIPLQTAMHRVMNVDYYTGILLRVRRVEEMDETASEITSLLHGRHHRLANLPDDFQVRNQEALIQTQTASATRLAFYVRTIGVAGLAVSGLGILAICVLAVKMRAVEIGTRRAVGANHRDVFAQTLLEAALLSFLGCAIGLGLGWQASRIANRRAGLPARFDAAVARQALLSAAAMNLIFALIPAAQAARVSPICALRYEA